LSDSGNNQNTIEDGIREEALEDVSFAVNFARVHLIEQCHHHKGIEDDSKVLRWQSVQRRPQAGVDVEEFVT